MYPVFFFPEERKIFKQNLRHKPLEMALLGLGASFILYAVFYFGFRIISLVWMRGEFSIQSVYALKDYASTWRLVLFLGLIIGPGEEILWRWFLQRRWAERVGPKKSFLWIALIYSLVHLATGNLLLVMAALICGLAPNVEVLILGRILQGVTNAFTTPILLAVLADVIPPGRLGRSMGIFGAVNTGGNLAAPVVAGSLAAVNWRLAYLVVALASLSLAAYYLRWFRGRRQADRQSRGPGRDVWGVPLRLLANPRFWPIAVLSAGGYVAVAGTYYLWAVYLADRWQVPVDRSGFLLSLYGLTGVLVGPLAGLGIDRFGRPVMVSVGIALAVLGQLALGLAPDPVTFGVFGAALGGVYALFWAGLNTLALEAFPKERGAAASLYNGFKFLGSAVAPLVLTPIYTGAGPTAPFLAVALFGLGLFLPVILYARLNGGD